MLRSLLCLLVLVTGIIQPSLSYAAEWWQQDWQFRKQISVDTTPAGGAINEPIGRAPVLVRLHTGNFTFEGVAQDGADIRFVAADGSAVLNHQIESFDPMLGIATIWVDVPTIEGGARQDIWMYYGNEAAPNTSNGQISFDPNYNLIYHFSGTGETPPRDTTAYGNHAQTVAGSPVESVIGRGSQFTGGAPLMLPASPSLAIPGGGTFTFSAQVRADDSSGTQLIYARRDSGSSLLIGVDQGVPFVELNGQRTAQAQPLSIGSWQHVAVTADGQQVQLYVNGRVSASLAAALPPLATVTAIGGDVPGALAATTADSAPVTEAEGAAPAESIEPIVLPPAFSSFVGAIDEIRISNVARPSALIFADAISQGSESLLVQYGADEQQSGFNFGGLSFLVNAIPFDAWIILGILALMMVQSWIIMISKSRNVARISAANEQFRLAFSKVGQRLELLADDSTLQARLKESALWRLYQVAINEIRTRRAQGADVESISAATIEAIRASMDAVRTKENQKLGAKLGILSNAIAGGPYIGLLGTVLGIMVVFLGTAMAGDVNINAIAPGMAAALMATAAGLFVAIPALFGYNRLVSRNKEVSADMRVFVDEFVTRLAEVHGQSYAAEGDHGNGASRPGKSAKKALNAPSETNLADAAPAGTA